MVLFTSQRAPVKREADPKLDEDVAESTSMPDYSGLFRGEVANEEEAFAASDKQAKALTETEENRKKILRKKVRPFFYPV